MCADFYNLAVLEYKDLICIDDSGETMGNDDTGTTLLCSIQSFLNNLKEQNDHPSNILHNRWVLIPQKMSENYNYFSTTQVTNMNESFLQYCLVILKQMLQNYKTMFKPYFLSYQTSLISIFISYLATGIPECKLFDW